MILILHLIVDNSNDNVLANMTFVTNTRTHAAFRKGLYRYASREIDNFVVSLFQIY